MDDKWIGECKFKCLNYQNVRMNECIKLPRWMNV